MIVNIVRMHQGFITIGPNLADGPEQYFQDVSQPTFIIKSVLYNTQTLILDCAVVRSLPLHLVLSLMVVSRYIVHISYGNERTLSYFPL